jgi:hypothetical protein
MIHSAYQQAKNLKCGSGRKVVEISESGKEISLILALLGFFVDAVVAIGSMAEGLRAPSGKCLESARATSESALHLH